VTTYLWTKGLGSGVLLVTSGALLAGVPPAGVLKVVAPALAVGATAATGALLVWDLKRPERFLYIFTKVNPRSWLFWGSVCLAGYAAVSAGWLGAALAESVGLLAPEAFTALLSGLRWAALPSGAAAAGYTAFLFGQAEGRDLWQSRVLLPHLLIQAVQAGSGILLALAALTGGPVAVIRALAAAFVGASAANGIALVLELGGGHQTKQAAIAARMITRGRYRRLFWAGAVGVGGLAAGLALPAVKGRRWRRAALGGLLGQVAVLAYESVFVRAGQDVPLS
jgi:Ni/Fe-hydrogenase subunit HybB-like protein